MRSITKLTISLLLTLATGASGCATLENFAAKHAGSAIGTQIGQALPVEATTSPTLKGGNACDTLKGLKAPVAIAGLPRNAATEFVLAVNKFGADNGCWQAPK